MKKLVLAACLVLVVGCTKKSAEPAAEPPPPSEPSVAAPEPKAEPAAQPAPEQPKKIEITDDVMKKYVAFTKEKMRIVTEYAQESQRKAKEAEKAGSAAVLKVVGEADAAAKKMEADVEKAREAAGLSADDVAQLTKVVDAIVIQRQLYDQAGGDKQIAEMEKSFKAQLANVPADKRAEAEAELAKMTAGLKAMANADDARKEFGDATVDLVLKYSNELMQVRLNALKNLGTK